ncbi:hypothetical protein [Rubrivirga sp. IMCC45206]|uniref:hypothetical protein n=1 Tax=Rubrivirga sp. IMCC45206 TaxID=3391614 RepID=UPI00398FDF26
MKQGTPTVMVGDTPLHAAGADPAGSFAEIDGQPAYRIDGVDRMAPFFVTVVSASDHWLFASSTGPLSAGRGTPDRALFPYETVDRIHDARDTTGGKTLLLVEQPDGLALWEPFSDRHAGAYAIRRSLSKTLRGDVLQFEEVNDDLGLAVTVTWSTSRRFGFVRRTRVVNDGPRAAAVRVLDGVQNVMPYGVSRDLQATRSVLADAYKKAERVPGTSLGLMTLSAIPVDRAEPSEALQATTVWSAGLEPDAILLSARQLDRFRAGLAVDSEDVVKAERGAYFVSAELSLAAGDSKDWDLVLDIEQDTADVVGLVDQLADPAALRGAVVRDVAEGSDWLGRLVAGADGEQQTAEAMTTARHRMNVLYNIMRGGVFDEGYSVVRDEVRAFVAHRNAPVAAAHADWFDGLPPRLTVQALREGAREQGPHLERLCAAYLPLSFSRRHGDPSRPWNHFSIDLRDDDGQIRRGYEGNWRDIFQNWEALGRSYPGYLEAFIATFVNASTADGYNPYRITAEGIDWERSEPDDPWSYIGYWGDHQLIYLLRLLVMSGAHHPGRLPALLSRRVFSYANVPYRIKPYADLLRDPHDTVVYDDALEATIETRVQAVGADGKLVWDADGDVLHVTLAEKLLIPVLAKLTNVVPEGGVWMNTQRPEWNDANNALVGYGVSMVTLFALRRFLDVLRDVLNDAPEVDAVLSVEVADLLDAVGSALETHADLADRSLSDAERKTVVDALGHAGSEYREQLYADGLSGETRAVPYAQVLALIDRAVAMADHTIAVNRRDDGLYHAYNLMASSDDGIAVGHLYAMLEGQVAALDAGVLTPQAAIDVLRALRASTIYRPDQHSYRLYPDRRLPNFLEKNTVPTGDVAASPLLTALLDAGDTSVVRRDVRGGVHFAGTFSNGRDVRAALGALPVSYAIAVRDEGDAVVALFGRVFDHRSYTGRSGTFFGYEGLGSIYWHMVSKLALATQETFFRALAHHADHAVLDGLADAYYDVRAGLGVAKAPAEFGAFPTDAYSHTPGHAGAKQPGMTGQVKEDILCRWGELGVLIEGGRIAFRPALLRASEFLTSPAEFDYVDVSGAARTIQLAAGSLAFTYCQVPVVYRVSDTPSLRVIAAGGATTEVDVMALPADVSDQIFRRTGAVERIDVGLQPGREA